MVISKRKRKSIIQGSISLLAVLSLAAILLAIPITVKLVQQRQEIRKEAAYPSLKKPSPSPEKSSPPLECKGENESCGDASDCCGGLQCASLSGGKFCISPACDEGLKRCSGDRVQECQQGVWKDIQRCDSEHGCDPRTATCVRTCSPYDKRCVGSVQETCSGDGSNWVGKSCKYGCNPYYGTCNVFPSPSPTGRAVCVPGVTRCFNSVQQTCRNDGSGWTEKSCPYGCEPGGTWCNPVALLPEKCSPGYSRCVGSYEQTCLDDGSGWGESVFCEYGCSSGQCLEYESGIPFPSPSPRKPPGEAAPLRTSPSPTASPPPVCTRRCYNPLGCECADECNTSSSSFWENCHSEPSPSPTPKLSPEPSAIIGVNIPGHRCECIISLPFDKCLFCWPILN